MDDKQIQPRRVRRWTRMVGALVLLSVAAALIWAGVRHLRAEAHDRFRFNRLKTGMSNLLFRFEVEPMPAVVRRDGSGHAILSWRLEAYCAPRNFPQPPRFDVPWHHPANASFARLAPAEYCDGDSRETRVFAIAGAGTAFDEANRPPRGELDGDTLLVVEVRDSGIHWMAPGDFDISKSERKTPRQAGFGAAWGNTDGFFVGFVDREVWFLSYDVPMATLLRFATVEGARQHDRERELARYRLEY